MCRLARTAGEELPVWEFDADDLPEPMGFLIWSDDPSAHTTTLGRPQAVLGYRVMAALRALVLDDAGPSLPARPGGSRQADPYAAWGRPGPATSPAASRSGPAR